MRAELVTDLTALEARAGDWAALAAASDLPYCAPGWMLGWWRHAAPPDADLRVALVLEDDTLVGIAPWYVSRVRGVPQLQLLASPISHRTQPLAVTGRERDVAACMVEALADSRPRPGALPFAGLPEDSPWPGLVASAWPGRLPPATRVEDRQPAPFIDVASTTAEDWFKSRSSNFRGQMRRARRDLEARGARARMASTPEEIARDVDALIRLHHARWSWRGGSAAMTPGVERMLREEAAALVQMGTLRLAGVATAEETVAVQAIVAAGGEASYWLGGFDAEWAGAKPGIVALHTALEDSFAHSDVRFDLGGGDQDYKRRFTDSEQVLAWTTVLPRFARTPLDRLLMAPWRARSWLADVTRGPREQLARRSRERARRRLLGHSKDGGEGH